MAQKSVATIKYADTNAVLTVNQSKAPTDLSRSIQVIGAGFSRTGTVSFTLALEKLLKGPVCHSGSASLVREEGVFQSQSQGHVHMHVLMPYSIHQEMDRNSGSQTR